MKCCRDVASVKSPEAVGEMCKRKLAAKDDEA